MLAIVLIPIVSSEPIPVSETAEIRRLESNAEEWALSVARAETCLSAIAIAFDLQDEGLSAPIRSKRPLLFWLPEAARFRHRLTVFCYPGWRMAPSAPGYFKPRWIFARDHQLKR